MLERRHVHSPIHLENGRLRAIRPCAKRGKRSKDAQAFLLQKIREERLDEVYSTGRRLFLKALNEEGLSPRPSSAWVAFRDALLDQEDDDVAAQPVATTRENLDFMRHLRGAKVRDWRP